MKLLTVVPGKALGKPGCAAFIVDLEGARFYQTMPGSPSAVRGAPLFVIELEQEPTAKEGEAAMVLASVRATISAMKACLGEWEALERKLAGGQLVADTVQLPGHGGAKA